MVACARCQTQNREGSRFCNECGARLGGAAPPREERKHVTALFCDLVGFTSAAEAADPEDVDRVLTRYFAMARGHVEGHGGVVEKFIGDAVVGVFGVPAAHEDDPERAVRAALRIAEDASSIPGIGGQPLRLRIGINTGEALVRLDLDPRSGERFLAGDAINTASRIQSLAPEMGVAVGAATHEATRGRFDFQELPLATVKGKSAPVRVFRPIAPKARLGTDLTLVRSTPYIGREREVSALTSLLDAALATESVRFALVVGEPGLGKSRLIAELLAHADAQPMLITWRQGRCLPYGTGLSFWALGEIVKAHAGILESDPSDVAIEKLETVLPEGDERPWFRDRLLPLLGIEPATRAERDEQFAAWQRFLERVAAERPTVIVFEDLHWADDAMLEFLTALAGQPGKVPLLVVGTARPELLERRPDFASGGFAAERLDLRPLSPDDTTRMVGRLLGGSVAPLLVAPILERANGNPLFAQEFVRLLRDRDLVVETDGMLALRPDAVIPVPDSITALISARLDALPADHKGLLGDASVVGKVFWSGALTAMGSRDRQSVSDALDALADRELVRPALRSSMAGESEYAFGHVLARDVAYGSLPRAARAARHVAAARWIEAKASARIDDVADILAHHYTTALDLAVATGATDLAAELQEPAFRFLSLAGERALGLDASAASALLERALELAPPGHPERVSAILRHERVLVALGRYADAAALLEEALATTRQSGDVVREAEVLGALSSCWMEIDDDRAWNVPRQIVELLEPLGPSAELADAYGRLGTIEVMQGRVAGGLELLDRAVEVAQASRFERDSDAARFRALALGFRALARARLGERRSLDEFREAVSLAAATGQGSRVAILYNNMAGATWSFDGPIAALAVLREGLAFSEARGLRAAVGYLSLHVALILGDTEAQDEALMAALAITPQLEADQAVRDLAELRRARARILALLGRREELASLLESLDSATVDTADPDAVSVLATGAIVHWSLGEGDAAARLVEALAAREEPRALDYLAHLPAMLRISVAIDRRDLVERLVGDLLPTTQYDACSVAAANAIVSEVRDDSAGAAAAYGGAAARWKGLDVVPEQAFALLGQGRCLVAAGRASESVEPLERARELFRRLGAAPALEEAESLLRRAAPARA